MCACGLLTRWRNRWERVKRRELIWQRGPLYVRISRFNLYAALVTAINSLMAWNPIVDSQYFQDAVQDIGCEVGKGDGDALRNSGSVTDLFRRKPTSDSAAFCPLQIGPKRGCSYSPSKCEIQRLSLQVQHPFRDGDGVCHAPIYAFARPDSDGIGLAIAPP